MNGELRTIFPLSKALVVLMLAFSLACLAGCGGGSALGGIGEETDGPEFVRSEVRLNTYNAGSGIDSSMVSQGYVGAALQSTARLKFQVIKDGVEYSYDMTNDGSPNFYPMNMGNGYYTFNIMQNTRDNMYVTHSSTGASVALENEFEPFLRPNYFCNYSAASQCVAQASSITEGSANQGEALSKVYNWVVGNVRYDTAKAASVGSGYVPNPDVTLTEKTGICFDYASLMAAMLRSQGIPCKIITGYVSDGKIYHAWNEVYINGRWKTMSFEVPANTWSRLDATFAAGGDSGYVGDGSGYTDRYTY